MATKNLPCPTVLRLLMRYDEGSGELYWKPRARVWFSGNGQFLNWNKRYPNAKALTSLESRGYRQGCVLGRMAMAHRVAWAIHHGRWPADQVDHINGVKTDNRISNLRAAEHWQNCLNRGSRKGGSSRFLGVDALPNGKWRAQIKPRGGKNTYLGTFETEREAAMAYDKAATVAHGEFARLNEASA